MILPLMILPKCVGLGALYFSQNHCWVVWLGLCLFSATKIHQNLDAWTRAREGFCDFLEGTRWKRELLFLADQTWDGFGSSLADGLADDFAVNESGAGGTGVAEGAAD